MGPSHPQTAATAGNVLPLRWRGQGGQVQGYPESASSSSPLSIREVMMITHDNCCEGQVPADRGFGHVSSNSDGPLWRESHARPVSGEQGAGQWPAASQDGQLSLRTAQLRAPCPLLGVGMMLREPLPSPGRAHPGGQTLGLLLPASVSHRSRLGCCWGGGGCGVHDPGAPRRSQLTSGASNGSQDGGSASAWDPPAAQQVTSRVGRGPLGGQGQHVLPQGREKGQGKLTGSAGVCLQTAELRRAGPPRG